MKKLKLVLDTNVLISSFWGGNPEKILDLFKKNQVYILSSEDIIVELKEILERVIQNPYKINPFLNFFLKKVIIVKPITTISIIDSDPSDNKFLECALAGKADFIISGDQKHLIPLKTFKNTPIFSPKQFLDHFQNLMS